MKIPLADVCAQNSALSNEIKTAIGAVINSSSFIGGDEVESGLIDVSPDTVEYFYEYVIGGN